MIVEKDKSLSTCTEKFGENVKLNKDILECYQELSYSKPIKVFGNLPYNISTKILTSFININNLNKIISKFILYFKKKLRKGFAKENTEIWRLSILTSWKMLSSKVLDISPMIFYKTKVWVH